MTRLIIVPIEAGEKECGETCPFLMYYDGYHCSAFERTADDVRGCPTRLPACLGAEAKLVELTEAGQRVLWAVGEDKLNGLEPKEWDAILADLREALAALKGE